MKRNLLYLMSLITVIFASCDPLEKTYEEIENNNYVKEGMKLTIETAYPTIEGAKVGIEQLLNSSYAQLSNGSTATVTYNSSAPLPAQFKPADSLLTSIPVLPTNLPTLYTVSDADYAAINGNSFKNFSAANVIKFLDFKFPAKVESQLVVLNYTYYEGGVTTSAGAPVVETFLNIKGVWTKAYHLSQAQYISAGKLTVFNFAAADEPNLNGYFNAFLKSDASVASKAKAGDVKYISFAYFASSKTYQRIRTLVFNGVNWDYKVVPATNTLGFVKKGGKWIADPTVYYTLVTADYAAIADNAPATIGNVDNRANLKRFNNFNLAVAQSTVWTNADVEASLIYLLGVKYAAAPIDPTVVYNLTYTVYRPPTGIDTKKFIKTNAGFIVAPATP